MINCKQSTCKRTEVICR